MGRNYTAAMELAAEQTHPLRDRDIFGGLADAEPEVESFDLGQGITLRRTYAHLMAPMLMAFGEPASPGQHHPGPLKAARGGAGFDIHAELFVPSALRLARWFDHLNTVWWLAALMRLKGLLPLRVAVVSSHSFASIPTTRGEPELWPVESERRQMKRHRDPRRTLDVETLSWVRDRWHAAGLLMNSSEDFNTAVQAYDQCAWTPSVPLAMVLVWGALERLFSPARAELKFRVSANIATFLEPAGDGRLMLFKRVQKLYDARSAAAHGSGGNEVESYFDSCDLLRRVLIQIIERGNVPRREDLDAALLGA